MTTTPAHQRKSKWTAVGAALLAIATFGSAAPLSANNDTNWGKNHEASRDSSRGPEGSWLYTVTIPDPSGNPLVFTGVETYSAGGGYVEADQLAFLPGFLATAGHGAWKSTSERKFLLTYINLTRDAEGNPTGTGKVRQTARLSASGNSYSGSGDFSYYDLNDGLVAQGTFTITAKRIQVEAPQN